MANCQSLVDRRIAGQYNPVEGLVARLESPWRARPGPARPGPE